MTWDDIGGDYGDTLTVITTDGRSFTGTLVDFEVDFDGSYGGDSISLDIEGSIPIAFKEDVIAEIRPLDASSGEA